MIIERLEMRNFRNYENQEITFDGGVNVLFGLNAQGKTNALEALYMTATGKSHRTNTYQDLIKNGSNGFQIQLAAKIGDRKEQIEVAYSKDRGKCALVNGIKRDKISDILGIMNMILFSPETLEIIKGAPQLRRKFLDVMLCQVSKTYLYVLQQYQMIVKNKSAALKKSKYERKYDEILPIWNENMAKFGGRIAYIRHKTIQKLDTYMKQEMLRLSQDCEHSSIIYKTYTDVTESSDEAYFTERLRQKLEEGLEKERELSQCLYGPHRDDMEIMLNNMNSRLYCSQGQQRSLALSLVMAELRFMEEIRGDKPVLLLDDVLSELDENRQGYLINGLKGIQTIVTTTECDHIRKLLGSREMAGFSVNTGRVERVY